MMQIKYCIFKYVLAGLIFLVVCHTRLSSPDDTVVRIGDKTFSIAQFETRVQQLKKTGYGHIKELNLQNKRELLDGIIARELLIIEGIRRGFDKDVMINELVEKIKRQETIKKLYEQEAVQSSYVFTDEQLHDFFVEQQYDSEVLSQHIVCATEQRARQAIAALDEGASFESLVSIYSVENIQNRFGPQGWVGWFKIGELYGALKVPLSTMSPGSLYPEPIKTHSGYHVFRLKTRRPVELEVVREWVEEQARIQRRANDMERYVKALRHRYNLVMHHQAFNKLLQLASKEMKWSGEDKAIFSWNGGQLTAQEYLKQAHTGAVRHPALLDSANLHKQADNLAGRQIMMVEAQTLGLDKDRQIFQVVADKQAELMVKKLYQLETKKNVRHFSDTELRNFYDQNIKDFTRKDGKVTEFSFVQQSIRNLLEEQAMNNAMDVLLEELRENYKGQIEIFPDVLDLAFRR